ncbi:hypothetical protein ARMGADRAFT_71043 [Armillaria gallica]|uniref:Uncharacterized protein n=1 Tax=Armillaria gallica TaxID=47427 RepID=A0A2H3DI64_ARMGA|nr:hypothetical protein ARMGADRAFT_71043 [Armillaria gallica]
MSVVVYDVPTFFGHVESQQVSTSLSFPSDFSSMISRSTNEESPPLIRVLDHTFRTETSWSFELGIVLDLGDFFLHSPFVSQRINIIPMPYIHIVTAVIEKLSFVLLSIFYY